MSGFAKDIEVSINDCKDLFSNFDEEANGDVQRNIS